MKPTFYPLDEVDQQDFGPFEGFILEIGRGGDTGSVLFVWDGKF